MALPPKTASTTEWPHPLRRAWTERRAGSEDDVLDMMVSSAGVNLR